MTRPEVLCVGEAMVMLTDVACASGGMATPLTVHVGGAEANVARHLSAQGVRAGWMSRLGEDPFGRLVLSALRDEGVDISTVIIDDAAPTGIYFKDRVAGSGTRSYYYRAGSAASRLSADDVPALSLSSESIVHTSGVLAAISGTAAEFVDALFVAAKAAGATVSFDVNFRSQLWGDRDAASELLALAQRADIVMVGRDEAESLWATSSVDEAVALLSSPKIVVVKDGDVAAVEVDRRDGTVRTTVIRPSAVDVVELVGAGDAFAGGWLAGLIRGEAASARITRGHRAAAWTIGGVEDVRPGHRPDPFAAQEGH